ncbi:SDR family NAD(P)-dependent oxidoreductase [Maritimibacter sp. UBA3975]|uniref:SDR family NAD(P)-dependent oxidoreductase n=1 Tax=Maritimibacter sp. UBA3975 TaxID=1946833 RepID=UPI000C0A0658|nr:SDR family NAD(P)-dependent oxidoreductase [Maritimibacter sp. UBA3975]MAM61160.1 oxidoreductase [Maritimibacter sp.]|tara:strand:+ start:4959 stop:5612 length:654 start_codon:yes stop_codon:yes gene_type:complete
MSDKIALITGASRGLGAALAVELAPTHHIVAVARTTGALEELDDKIKAAGGEATLAPMDVTNSDAMAQLCRAIHDRWGKVDVWAHTAVEAQQLMPANHVALAGKDWEKSIAVNLDATARLIAFVAPLLGEAGTAAFFHDDHAGEKFFGAYGATKAGQMALARSWQAETAALGPKVRILTPKPLASAMRARFHPGEDRDALAKPADEAKRLLPELLGG